jgi:arginine repressor
MNLKPLEMVILDAYRRYGQKLYVVLLTAIKITKVNKLKGVKSFGDFEYRELVEELEKQGFKYNPSMLLRILEREYGLIETSYKTANNHWYKFKDNDLEEIEKTLNSIIGIDSDVEEPDIAMIKIQIKSMQINYWLKKLKQMSIKSKLNSADIKIFQRFAFNVLPKIVRMLKKAEEYEDKLYAEINLLKELISLGMVVADRIDIEISLQDSDNVGITTKTDFVNSINDSDSNSY